MKLIDIKNARYNKDDTIDCEILIENFEQYIPYTASLDDIEEQGQKIYNLLTSGMYCEIEPYIETEPEEIIN